jgi:DNA invertase Pin-like site-specific DNA recombinase
MIGYARVSPGLDDAAGQRKALERAGCTIIHEDRTNSASADILPGLREALDALRAGDTLVVWRLDRLGQTLSGLVEKMQELTSRGVALRSLCEDIDTSGADGRVVYQVMRALADCERALSSERIRAGLQAAHEKGRSLGRPRALTDAQRKDVIEAIVQRGESLAEVASRHNVHTRTIRRLLQKVAVDTGRSGVENEPLSGDAYTRARTGNGE